MPAPPSRQIIDPWWCASAFVCVGQWRRPFSVACSIERVVATGNRVSSGSRLVSRRSNAAGGLRGLVGLCGKHQPVLPVFFMMDSPAVVFILTFVLLWLSAQAGAYLHRRRTNLKENEQHDLEVILAASLTLLGLIIGFSFSMAVTRYDQRKNYEEAEANAIGTEYFRASLLPVADAEKIRGLMEDYLNQRVLFYTTRDARRIEQIGASTLGVQIELWSAVKAAATPRPTPVVALAVSGLNDVFNSQGYTQAAWWNRIPIAAWALMGVIAVFCNFLFGYTARHAERRYKLFLVLPLIVAISFFLIADLDSPRHGVIRVSPRNLMSLSRSMRAQ